jgi:hypothetical protein
VEDRQQPLVGVVGAADPEDVEARERQACRDLADCIEGFAATLPISSEVRSLMLRSAARWKLIGLAPPGPHLRQVPSLQAG